MPTGIGAIGPVAPHLGHVEHLADAGQNPIGRDRDSRQIAHQSRYMLPGYVRHFEPAQHRHDETVDLVLIGINGARLVARSGVFLHELGTQLFDGRRHTRSQFRGTRIVAFPHISQPVLRDRAGLLDGQLAKLADFRLVALAPVRALPEHEDLAPAGGDFAEKSGDNGVPQFVIFAGDFGRIDSGFCELDLGHDAS
jgi:hypothetical protein